MKAWKALPIFCFFLSLGQTPLAYGNEETPPWEEDEDIEFQTAKSSDDIPPWEEEEEEEQRPEMQMEKEVQKQQPPVDNSFPELNYENMNIQAANQKEVESKNSLISHSKKVNAPVVSVTKVSNQTHKIAVSYYGEQKTKDTVIEENENHHIDESQLISGSAPLYQ